MPECPGWSRLTDLPGVILAGGLSRRMGGGDKTLQPIAGRPMLAWVIEGARKQARPLALNANGPSERFAAFGLPVLPDRMTGHLGPLAGIATGLAWARAQASSRYVAFFASDTPFFPDDLVEILLAAAITQGAEIVLPASAGQTHGTLGLWRCDVADALEQAIRKENCRKVQAFTTARRTVIVPFAATPYDPFFNVNTPEEFERAKAIARLVQSR